VHNGVIITVCIYTLRDNLAVNILYVDNEILCRNLSIGNSPNKKYNNKYVLKYVKCVSRYIDSVNVQLFYKIILAM